MAEENGDGGVLRQTKKLLALHQKVIKIRPIAKTTLNATGSHYANSPTKIAPCFAACFSAPFQDEALIFGPAYSPFFLTTLVIYTFIKKPFKLGHYPHFT
jgi:hypothetical protein